MLTLFCATVFTLNTAFGGNLRLNEDSSCDPLVPEYCSLPFPSDYYLEKDENLNPLHLTLTEQNLPYDNNGLPINPSAWNTLDGFSPNPALLTYFDDLSIDNCARLWNIGESLADDSPVIILDVSTMTRIPHWVELDHLSDNQVSVETRRAMMIWPAYRLSDSHRYIIALRGLKRNDGYYVELSNAFVALRDNIASDEISDNRRDYYESQIFPYLLKAGIDRDSLQLTWDVTVMSTAQQTNRMLHMRDDAFSRARDSPYYRITNVENDFKTDYVARKVGGKILVPWYLDSALPQMTARLVTEWDDDLTPVYQHDWEVDFEMIIPRSVGNHSIQGRFVQYGHGLFGDYHEIEQDYLVEEMDRYGYIMASVNWLGMCSEDEATVAQIISTNLTNFPYVPDRLHQGMTNALLLMKLLLSNDFLNDDVLHFDGELIVNPEHHHYYGNSLGGIMGSVYMSLTTDVTRGVLGVPGFPFELVLARSCDFNAFKDIMETRYKPDIDKPFLLSFMQLLFNRLAPSGYLHHISEDVFKNTPVHSVLIHYGLGDAQVTWLGSQQLARSIGGAMFATNVAEYNETIFAAKWIDDDAVINVTQNKGFNAIQGWNFDLPQVPFVNQPPDCSYDAHEYPRRQTNAQRATQQFLIDGLITNFCSGPCNGTPSVHKSD